MGHDHKVKSLALCRLSSAGLRALSERSQAVVLSPSCVPWHAEAQCYGQAQSGHTELGSLVFSVEESAQAWLSSAASCYACHALVKCRGSTHRGARTHDHKVKSLALC